MVGMIDLNDVTPERVLAAGRAAGVTIGRFSNNADMCPLEALAVELTGESGNWCRIIGDVDDREGYALTWGFAHGWDGHEVVEGDRAYGPALYDKAFQHAVQLKEALNAQKKVKS